MTEPDRHTIDRIARAAVSGRRGLGRGLDRMADGVAGLMRGRLEAVGAPGALRARALPRMARPLDARGRRLADRLLARAAKHLARAALARDGRGGPHQD